MQLYLLLRVKIIGSVSMRFWKSEVDSFFIYKNIFYKDIEAEIWEIFRIF